ncbi:hypothetical protein DEU56DRAFT_757737 [Suillus clintonianus]|uniref:uncharacterized protein n=1 Tax=Suillus clintonianus TaxID=1904413 RepID=UPI001B883A66|nr:uncharacterized protein DEU56DRAFT_757737 [Suillus clintonianus]KAG2130896.1 hypothetical protein DEU56DRAFT_757737 [Suillus clintonianus]
MAESSYIPMNDLKNRLRSPRASHSMKNAPLASELSLEYDDSPDGRVAESLTPLRPLRPHIYHQHHSPNARKSFWLSFYNACKSLLFPMVAIGYLAFCYTVHNHSVPLNTHGLIDTTPANLIAIKGAITSISIIIITIALYPLNSMLSDLRSEEFFRVLSSRPHRVPLSTVNSISSPSFGYISTIKAMIGRNCSRYFVACTTASIMVLVVSTLAPATLSIQSVLADGDIMAFAVAAVPAQSVWNGSTNYLNSSGLYASNNAPRAAYLLWAEMMLNVRYSFSTANSSDSDIAAYIVPAPVDLSTTTSSRWLTDVIGINPSCAWSSTNITGTVDMSSNDTEVVLGVNLQDADLDVSIIADSSFSAYIIDPTSSVLNHSTLEPPTDGSTVFQISQCVAGCDMTVSVSSLSEAWLNFTGLPSFQYQQDGAFFEVAFLVCKPNVQITTREVRNNGLGMLSVQPSPNGVNYKTQGNLHPRQTPALLSFAMMDFSANAGPFVDLVRDPYGNLGTVAQRYFLFGREKIDNLPSAGSIVNLTVLSTANLSATFTTMLQSSSKAYLTGYLGTAYVPGRLSTPEVVFATSMPHLAVSTAIFMLLFIMTVVTHFRRGKGGELTLINIGAALYGSELPTQISQTKADLSEGSRPLLDRKSVREDVAEMIGDRSIFMQQRADGSGVLRIT